MNKFTVEFYETENDLREPYSKPLTDGIFELRARTGRFALRVLYFFYIEKRIVLTNGFVKKTRKTPKREIEKAKLYRADHIAREELKKKEEQAKQNEQQV